MSGSTIAEPIAPETGVVPAGAVAATPAESDASCRLPVALMLVSAAVWVFLAGVCGLLASVKLHSGGFLSACPTMTYGRLYAAATSSFLYGFALQAGLGTAVWLMARTSAARLRNPLATAIGAAFWNLGVTVGVVGILAGHNTGYEWLEFPGQALLLLFVSFAVVAVQALLTFHDRGSGESEPSQWYLIAGLFAFPWALSAAGALLLCQPVRGVVQIAVHTWFSSNLLLLVLTPMGIAALLHFVPLLTNRSLASRSLAGFSLAVLMLCGGWAGLNLSAPLPAWLVAASMAAGTLVMIPALGTLVNLRRTLAGGIRSVEAQGPARFFGFSAVALLVAGVVTGLISFPVVNRTIQLTFFGVAVRSLWLYAFFGMAAFGAIYHILPRLAGCDWPSSGMLNLHFWLAALGTIPTIGVVAAGGFIQGHEMAKLAVPFSEVIRLSMPALRFSTLGDLLLLAGHAALLGNICLMCRSLCRAKCAVLCGCEGMQARGAGGTR